MYNESAFGNKLRGNYRPLSLIASEIGCLRGALGGHGVFEGRARWRGEGKDDSYPLNYTIWKINLMDRLDVLVCEKNKILSKLGNISDDKLIGYNDVLARPITIIRLGKR